MPRPAILTEEHREVLSDLVNQGLTNQQIQDVLLNEYHTPCSLSTLTRARSGWGLHARYDTDTQDLLQELVTFYHKKGLRPQEIIDILSKRHALEITKRTLARHCKSMDLHRRQDDVDRGLVTLDQVAEFIRTSKRRPDGKLAGYQRVQNILRHQNNVVVHR
ncbi:uncharacterized protein MELLADRAFT_69205 [Melampsora larici-populina 98AG31]|uniref:Clr5 domain-containing protein n=1 Tax=Melampsora larici-populina (strain 98AG31 / pathotype 3-4-7) TaxID=747676 RepID=F4S9S8_MELLP|nr:uncharacterized protein MELLADRAFT_69205 [Melampsora larici-populina 98AG31]EGF98605.1 hypothetical protein MELLADRAFT_69205 [Melampsora larici-populina 98AG31]